jgi:dipeptidyl aminopeptidase/acylaminoacyl peptidase
MPGGSADMDSAPYGSWVSPISARKLASSEVKPDLVAFDDGVVYWTEMRPTEGGRYVLVSNDGITNRDWTPTGFNVRSLVHEYGGGSFCVSDATVYFSNFNDQRLYRQGSPGEQPTPVTTEPDDRASVRFADMRVSTDGRWLVCIRETHGETVTNEVVAVDISTGAQRVLASGADFYAHPRLSPDDRRLAYVTWDHPNMPWDTTAIHVVDLVDGEVQGAPRKVAGEPDESVIQPGWSPNGVLHFVSDRSNWWNIYRLDEAGVTAVCPMDVEFGCPMWSFGQENYDFLGDGRIVAVCTDGGVDRVGIVSEGRFEQMDVPIEAADAMIRADGGMVALLGGGPTLALGVHRLDVSSGTLELLEPGSEVDLDSAYISVPEPIEFPTDGGKTAHALFYAPTNPSVDAGDGELPPLLVECHGGPTSRRRPLFDIEIQFWTTRGFGVVDVNYGGSTGYGREYRERLKRNWGVVDIQDCVAAARYLIERGDADAHRIAIRGGSAGGYTTLSSLAFTDFYAAGASHFGLGDLETFVGETHKFEERYLESLVGPYPQEAETYRARSAVFHAGQISCPVILFQGLEDLVVPPSQAEEVVEALEANGLVYAYIALEGEQHGFRKAESIEKVADAELYFYARVFGFELPAGHDAVEIHNL